MNAGVASVSLVSVGVVPYGASPYTAIVKDRLPAFAVPGAASAMAGTVHSAAPAAAAIRILDRMLSPRSGMSAPTLVGQRPRADNAEVNAVRTLSDRA
jgi:hypothetical protein